MGRIVEAFAALCREAERHGATIGFKLMQCSMIDNLSDALTLVETVGARNGGLPGSPRHDPSRARRFCGEGEFDIRGLIACARGMGYAGPWAVEVMSRELTTLPLAELNRRAYQTTMAQFAE